MMNTIRNPVKGGLPSRFWTCRGRGVRSKCMVEVVSTLQGWASAVILPAVVLCCSRTTLGQIPCQYEIAATIVGPTCPFFGPTGLVPEAISPNGTYVTGRYAQCEDGEEAFLWIGPPPGRLFTIPRPVDV